MNNRNHNIYFHLHTISGILVCAILYVIFFAGSFSFFKKEIQAWEKGQSYTHANTLAFDYDTLIDSINAQYDLRGRDMELYLQADNYQAYISLTPSKDSLANAAGSEAVSLTYDFAGHRKSTYTESYDLGEFLYRLHFLAQLNAIPLNFAGPFGYVLAGLVSFLFLFALITGLLLHWNKIASNFFVFRPWSKWKTVWTDVHTVLGVIGYPYQFIYAVTGIVLIFNTALLLPFSKLLYKDNPNQLYDAVNNYSNDPFEYQHKPLQEPIDINTIIQKVDREWPATQLTNIQFKNYGDAGMHIVFRGAADPHADFAATGKLVYRVADDTVVFNKPANTDASYIDWVRALAYRLHFGDYGGYPLKIIYFILGIMGCIITASGIMIWLVARDKNTVPAHKRKFNCWAANVFLAVCLTMLPVTAFTFIAVKATHLSGQDSLYSVYFYSWLVLSVYYVVRRNIRRTHAETLLLGSLLGLLVPVVNGIFGGNWLWNTWREGAVDILAVDLLWIAISAIGLVAFVKMKARKPKDVMRRSTAKQMERTANQG
ncbi:PepSY-associated TM helix domain-containing protein [Parapedobacter lycopersici]|uniref:PepSY-associated TM helix domain-containing protein n=1 Tax=Parapedobacter lycopersici TaxID=1864939 RepID=UPI0033425933